MRSSSFLFLAASLAACSSSGGEPSTASPARGEAAVVSTEDPHGEEELAYLAGGCFWGVEHFLEQIDGVYSVESGYMGGTVEDPSYAEVSGKETGHLETVRVRFNPRKVTYEAVAKRFFEIHDPTQADGQGPDIGPQYRSAVFYVSPEQKRVAEALIERLRERGHDVVTELRPAGPFYVADDKHQDYYARTGKMPYCHAPVDRFGDGS
jgi:peptide methionine sulfoxide reductase msrA/msrB